MNTLNWLSVAGYKSIRRLELALRNLNVFIGANGSGKSNLLSVFRLLAWQFSTPTGRLQEYIGRNGGANAILHDGSKITQDIEIDLNLLSDHGPIDYFCRLSHTAADTLAFTDECCQLANDNSKPAEIFLDMGHGTLAGHFESKLLFLADDPKNWAARIVLDTLKRISIYQFHDTSFNSRIRGKWSVGDYLTLKEDGANLASVLLHLQSANPQYYRISVDSIRAIVPFFEDFSLHDEHGYVLLRWREKGSDKEFDVSQASDGMLRAMALVTLLNQPPQNLPSVLIIDEPELGLHPSAIEIISGMIRNVARHVQVIVSTQSLQFVDEFEPEDIVVVDRPRRATEVKRLDPKRLEEWLQDYSLSELWEKNVIGGRP